MQKRAKRALEPHLQHGIDVRAATALLDTLTMPEVYGELTQVHAWSADAYEGWLARALREELLGG